MLWLGGTRYNALSTGNGVTASPVADTLFPTTKLYDGYPGDIFKFGSLTASPTLTADLDMSGGAAGGGFESGTVAAAGWTAAVSGSGTADLTITIVYEGSYALELDAGSGTASVYRDIVVRAGARYSISIALRGDGGLGRASLVCRNQNTSNYLNGGAWGSASNEVVNGPTASAYTLFDHASDPTLMTFQVESAEACGGPLTTLRFQINNDGSTTVAYADSFSIFPVVNFASVHGHNIDPRSVPVFRASTDNFSGSNVSISTPTLVKPAFYSTFTAAHYRYWRIAFADTNSAAIYLGEWVLGYATTMSEGPMYPYEPTYSAQQVRVPRRFGAPNVYAMGSQALRAVPLKIMCRTMAARTEFFLEWNRCLDGTPVVVVPYIATGHTDVVLGLLPETMDHSWQLASAARNIMNFATSVTELPLPLVVG